MRAASRLAFPVLAAALLAGACASSGKAGGSAADSGSQRLHAIVTERQYDAGGGSSGYRGGGTYYLSFEAQDGDKTVHYRFPVTREQYSRYPEGTAVTLLILDEQLRDIRPAQD